MRRAHVAHQGWPAWNTLSVREFLEVPPEVPDIGLSTAAAWLKLCGSPRGPAPYCGPRPKNQNSRFMSGSQKGSSHDDTTDAVNGI